MFMQDFTEYLDRLDSASIKNEADKVREAWSQTAASRVVQRILGNFWEDEELNQHLNEVINALRHYPSQRTFISNRVALISQLVKHPRLCRERRESLEYCIQTHSRIINDSWVALFQKAATVDRYREWFRIVNEQDDLKVVMSSFLSMGLYHKDVNLAAYCIMDSIEGINYNFHSFCTTAFKRTAEEQAIIRRLDNPRTPEEVVTVMRKYRPDLIPMTIVGGTPCDNPECLQCQSS